MAIYAIGDLHLSFLNEKPMNIFGDNWENHVEKIKENWIKTVKENDLVLLPGDFSWAMYLEEAEKEFKFLNELPGKKLLSKGNHDYWWTTQNKMNKFLIEKKFETINFIYNNSYIYENKIICGTRGWIINTSQENYKILKRENARLELSLKNGIEKYGDDKEIIVCLHYPPFSKEIIKDEINLIKTMEKYNVKKCLYGHLHGESHKEAFEGEKNGIEYILVSSDYLEFNLKKIVD